MIDRHVVGRGTEGTVRYVFEGRRDTPSDKQPYLLGWRGVGTSSIEEMVADFEIGQQANRRLDNVVWHVSLSFNLNDTARLDNRKMLEIAEGYLEKMGMAQTQYIIVRHHDTAHQHLHLIVSRVDDAGKAIADGQNFIDSKKVLQELIEQHGLTAPKGLQPELQHPEKLHGTDLVRCELRQVIGQELGIATSLADLTATLQKQGLEVRCRLNQAGEPTGISFSNDKIACRGSELGKDYSLPGIERQLAANLARHQAAEAEAERARQAQREQERVAKQQATAQVEAALIRQLPEVVNLVELQRRLLAVEQVTTRPELDATGKVQGLVFTIAALPGYEVRDSELTSIHRLDSIERQLQQQEATYQDAQRQLVIEQVQAALDRQLLAVTTLPELQQQLLLSEQVTVRPLLDAAGSVQNLVFSTVAQPALEVLASELVGPYQPDSIQHQLNQQETAQREARQEAEYREAEAWRAKFQQHAEDLARLVGLAQQAEKAGDYGRVAELVYGEMAAVQTQQASTEEQAAATEVGVRVLTERRDQAAAAEQVEQQRAREEQQRVLDEQAHQAAAAALAAEQRAAQQLAQQLLAMQQQVEEQQQLAKRAEQDGDYGRVAELRYGTLRTLEDQVETLQQQLAANPSGEAELVVARERQQQEAERERLAAEKQQREAEQQRVEQQRRELEKAQAAAQAREQAELTQLDSYWCGRAYHVSHEKEYLRLQVPADYLPQVLAALPNRELEWGHFYHQQDRQKGPRIEDGRVGLNINYSPKVDILRLNAALESFAQHGVELFERPAGREKRGELVRQAIAKQTFEREYAAGLHRGTARQAQNTATKDVERGG